MGLECGVRRVGIALAGVAVCAGVLAVRPPELTAQVERVTQTESGAADDLHYARSLSRAFQRAAEKVEPSVVHITTESERIARDFFGRRVRQQASGLGSGVVVTEDGYILTNNHVVQGATRLFARLHDGRTVDARLVGGDPLRDLAVLKVDSTGLTPARFGESAGLNVGEWVLAVGSPFGFDQTVTAGIVSAKGRGLGIINGEYKDAEEFIQTDAAINPGNSGGPLINLDGEVVGINSAIFSRTGGSIGLGFSIPSELAQVVYHNLVNGVGVDFGYLGIKLEAGDGVRVAEVVEDSPAMRAGIRPGDRLVGYRGKPVLGVTQLLRSIQFTPPGSEAPIEVERGGRGIELVAHVGALTQEELRLYDGRELPSVGLKVISATPRRIGTGEGDNPLGAQVIAVSPGSVAEEAGFQRGDLIVSVDGETVRDAAGLVSRLSRAGARARIDLVRDDPQRGRISGYTYLQR